MSRWREKRKRWYDRHAMLGNKQINKKLKKNRHYQVIAPGLTTTRINSGDRQSIVVQTPPKHFSLVDNPEETMRFFMDFANEINRNQYGTHFFVDSRNVETVTVDALIYLIAILQNDKVNNYLRYSFAGSYPENEEARRIYTESGFTDYVHSNMMELPKSNDRVRIISGVNNSPESAKELCDFVIGVLRKRRKDIIPLQKVVIELMSNVYHHAYKKNSFMAKKWYMYAEHIDNYVRCVFVDTGFGIAKTARKKFGERFQEFFGIKLDDSRIIKSVFDGDFRTATNQEYRGNGLFSVRENVRDSIFDGFEVFSGRGRCIISKDEFPEQIVSLCYEKTLYGTLYQFIVK